VKQYRENFIFKISLFFSNQDLKTQVYFGHIQGEREKKKFNPKKKKSAKNSPSSSIHPHSPTEVSPSRKCAKKKTKMAAQKCAKLKTKMAAHTDWKIDAAFVLMPTYPVGCKTDPGM